MPDLITEDELADLDGWVLSRPIGDGGLIDRPALVPPGSSSGRRSMSLAVPVEHAAGGSLVPGDLVDVISVVDGAGAYVASGLEVLFVSESSSGGIGTVSSHHVVVSVDAEEALALAEALDSGSVEIVRATGAEAITGGVDGP